MSPAGTNGHGAPNQNGDPSADLLELADALMERARTLASQADQLIAALDETARRLVESGQGVEGAPLRVPVSLIKQLGETDESTETNGSAEAERVRAETRIGRAVGLGGRAPFHLQDGGRGLEPRGDREVLAGGFPGRRRGRGPRPNRSLAGYGAGQRPSPVRSKVSIRVSLAKIA